jgi:CheY-like chemotaxis protein
MWGKHVLIVEDEPLVRMAMRQVLQYEGYDVSCAGDGKEALAHLRRGEKPDLILLDLRMPVLDGWAFLEEQGRDGALAGIPVVVVSASSEQDIPPVAGHVRKPFQPRELVEAIRREAGGGVPLA